VSISDSISRILGSFRTITDGAILVSDSISRILGSFRTITESTISISDSISRVIGYYRTLTEAALTVGDVISAIKHAPAMVIQNTVQILRTSRITTYIARVLRNTVYG